MWVRLVLQNFENIRTEEAMEAILEDIPTGLHDLYARILTSIENDPHTRDLRKSILTWVVLAATPLSLDELRCAIKLDLSQTIPNMAKAIPDICGQLVFVDQSQKVQIIHDTSRQFLLQANLEFHLSIQVSDASTRLSFLLLQYLRSGVLKARQSSDTRLLSVQSIGGPRGPLKVPDQALLDHAARFFPYHIQHSGAEMSALTEELVSFLKSRNVLHWIEHHAQRRDLSGIINAAMNFKAYLERIKVDGTSDSQAQSIDPWVVDLVRVAAKFRAELLSCPSSIHCLVPPLCPPQSLISQSFSRDAKPPPLLVRNLPDGGWDDCLARIDYTEDDWTIVVTHGQGLFAVGFSSGQVAMYGSNSLQHVGDLKHDGWVELLRLYLQDDILVSCSRKKLTAWDTRTGISIGSSPLPSLPLDMMFLGSDELLMLCQNSGLVKL